MGLLNTYFVGSDMDAKEFDWRNQKKIAAKFEAKGLTHLEIAELWAVLQGINYSQELLETFTNICSTDSEWIFRFPKGLTERLAILKDDEFDAVSIGWLNYEEMTMRRWQPSDAQFIFVGLRQLANAAKEKGSNIYLWISL